MKPSLPRIKPAQAKCGRRFDDHFERFGEADRGIGDGSHTFFEAIQAEPFRYLSMSA